MIHRPTTFRAKNIHSIAHFFPDQVRDVDRLEDLLADAYSAAREAVSALDEMRYEDIKPVERYRRELAKQVERHNLLNDDVRYAVQKLLHHLAGFPPEDPDLDNPPILGLRRALHRSLHGLLRVADLLAAELEIEAQRGIRR
jgi:hypothetical protein